MSYEHYIRVDDQSRIVDGFSTYSRQPEEGDILLRAEGGEVFDILEDGVDRPLWFSPPAYPDGKIYRFAWTGEQVRMRSGEEWASDVPPVPPAPDTGTRIADAEADIAVLLKAINIMTGGN